MVHIDLSFHQFQVILSVHKTFTGNFEKRKIFRNTANMRRMEDLVKHL